MALRVCGMRSRRDRTPPASLRTRAELARNELPESPARIATLDALRAVAAQPAGWGLQFLFGTAGFLEWLERWDTEPDTSTKFWKHLCQKKRLHSKNQGLCTQNPRACCARETYGS